MADSKGLTVKKGENFSEWFTEIVQKAELADLRYNVKGFLVFQPWSVMAMENIYRHLEGILRKKGHEPYWFPTVIPEGNLIKEGEHLKGYVGENSFIFELAWSSTNPLPIGFPIKIDIDLLDDETN